MRRRNGWGLAFIAACLFVLQSVVGAFAFSSMPAFSQSDAFGNALCISADHASNGNHDGGHGKAADCCLLGCCMCSQVLAAAPQSGEIITRQVASAAHRFWSAADPSPTGEHRLGYPRGPPRLHA
ncbi:hypothetical protein [Ensifer adhaerens]|uniref:hypothetical protein n=1 Tax=Ensifer adhaerens TaxID=106592 RepID=UPI0023A92B88|nr:hypothetical protein [Ensifer adhaerens]